MEYVWIVFAGGIDIARPDHHEDDHAAMEFLS
jgi:hypothetical protein